LFAIVCYVLFFFFLQISPTSYHCLDEIIEKKFPGDNDKRSEYSLIRHERVRMAYLAVLLCHSVNGVARMRSFLVLVWFWIRGLVLVLALDLVLVLDLVLALALDLVLELELELELELV
jgi:hypothetical protein